MFNTLTTQWRLAGALRLTNSTGRVSSLFVRDTALQKTLTVLTFFLCTLF